jgi:hypothetical protein
METALFGFATLAVIGFTSWHERASKEAFKCALLLAALFSATNLLNINLPYPQALMAYPILDLVAGSFVALVVFRRFQFWSFVLSMTFLAQCGLHVIFWVGQSQGQDYSAVFGYMSKLNILFGAQLACVCLPGIADGLSRFIHSRLPDPLYGDHSSYSAEQSSKKEA